VPVDANHSLRSSSGQPRTPQLRWEWVLSQNRPALILETAGAPAMQEPGAPKIQLSIRSIDQRTGQDRDPTHIEATQVRPAAALSPSCWPLAPLSSIPTLFHHLRQVGPACPVRGASASLGVCCAVATGACYRHGTMQAGPVLFRYRLLSCPPLLLSPSPAPALPPLTPSLAAPFGIHVQRFWSQHYASAFLRPEGAGGAHPSLHRRSR